VPNGDWMRSIAPLPYQLISIGCTLHISLPNRHFAERNRIAGGRCDEQHETWGAVSLHAACGDVPHVGTPGVVLEVRHAWLGIQVSLLAEKAPQVAQGGVIGTLEEGCAESEKEDVAGLS